MKIPKGVSWHEFGEKIYVHSVENQHDYILDGTAADVLNYFRENPDGAVSELVAQIAARYDIPNDSELQRDISEFVESLLAEKILVDSEPAAEIWTDEIANEVSKFFARERRLFSVAFELTYRCVERCIHCYIDDAPKFCAGDELTLAEYAEILKQARALGCVKILLTGGEVLLRKDFCDIVERAVDLGLIVDVYTTGVGLTDEIFDRLCAAKVNSVSFSLYSGVASEHDVITGLSGSFEKTLKAMLMFNSAGVQTFIKCVAIRQNFSALESVYKLGRRLKIRVSISPQIASGHAAKSASDFRLSEEQYEKFFRLESRYAPVVNPDAIPPTVSQILDSAPCSAGLNSLSIDPFGGVHPCISFTEPVGSLRTDSLKNLFEKIRGLKYFRDFKLRDLTPKCAACDFVKSCHVCIGELLKEKSGAPDDCGENLKAARIRAKFLKGGENYGD